MVWDKNSPFQDDFEDLELLGDDMFTIAINPEMPVEFKRRVFGAAKSYAFGNSVDYMIKKYGDSWKFRELDETTKTLSSLCTLVRNHSVLTIDYLLSIKGKSDPPNVFACSAAIMRLVNSFRAATLCVKARLHFEAATISRVILEQIAWIYSISQMPNSQSEFMKLKPQKTMSRLKEIIPNSGKGYGYLSKKGHLVFDETLNYIKVGEGGIGVQLHDRQLSAQDAANLLVLCDWLGIVGECVHIKTIAEPRFLRILENGKVEANPSREFSKVVRAGQELADTVKSIHSEPNPSLNPTA